MRLTYVAFNFYIVNEIQNLIKKVSIKDLQKDRQYQQTFNAITIAFVKALKTFKSQSFNQNRKLCLYKAFFSAYC